MSKVEGMRDPEFSRPQVSRLRESISADLRKLGDMAIPTVRPPFISVAAAARATAIGVNLKGETWHTQTRFDPGRKVFHYEHLMPLAEIIKLLTVAGDERVVLQVLCDNLSVAWITKEEDSRLTKMGYRSNRPDPMRAYTAAKIELQR